MKFPFFFFCDSDDGTGAGGTTTPTEPPTTEPPTQEPPATDPPTTEPPAPPLTPEETAAALARLAVLEEAEATRAADAETQRLAGLSEIERERAAREAAEADRDAEKQKLADEIASGNKAKLRTAAEKAATDLGYTLHPTALDDAFALGDLDSVTFNDAREPQGVTEAVKALVEKKPHYVAKAEAPNLSAGDTGRQKGADTTPETRRASRAMKRGF
jgi:hypothetical protein